METSYNTVYHISVSHIACQCRGHSEYGLSQWSETTLHCNGVSHWLRSDWTHGGHLILRPQGRGTEYLLWVRYIEEKYACDKRNVSYNDLWYLQWQLDVYNMISYFWMCLIYRGIRHLMQWKYVNVHVFCIIILNPSIWIEHPKHNIPNCMKEVTWLSYV